MTDFDSQFQVTHLFSVFTALLDGHFDVIEERPRISTGADRIDLLLFLQDRDKHLAAISRKIIEGRYTFSPFLERQIPKPESKDMWTISVATIRDCVVQRALYEYLYPVVDEKLSTSVFGYRKGRSAHDAIAAVRSHFENGRTFVFDADLRKFFDTVDHEVMLEMVGTLGLDLRAYTLIRRFLKTGRITSEQVEEHRARTGKQTKYAPLPRYMGVPQGGVLSGLLANFYLSKFDAAIREAHDGFVRYADDFLVCCASREECERVRELVAGCLKPLKVELHPDKTKTCVLAESGVNFLGFRISTSRLRIRGRNVGKFKARIRSVLHTQKLLKTPMNTLRLLVRRLEFKIRGPNQEQLKKLAARGKAISHCRRSWIGFFRIVDDIQQVRSLDRWLRKQISTFMWEKHRCRVSLKHMRQYGLPSLVNSLWKARSTRRPPPIAE